MPEPHRSKEYQLWPEARFLGDLQVGERRVRHEHTEVPFELGYEYMVALGRVVPASVATELDTEAWGLTFGAVVGHSAQVGSEWKTDDAQQDSREIPGPRIDASAPYARLVVGIGLYDTPRR